MIHAPHPSRLAALALVLAACSLDSSGSDSTSSGASGGGTPGGTTTGASMTTTSSGMGGGASTTASSTGTTATTTANGSSSSSSQAASSSSGGPVNVPFCTAVSDDFNGYADDGKFTTMAETTGPFGETGDNGGSVKWVNTNGGEVQTHYGSGKAGYLFTSAPVSIGSSTCAVTVKLVTASDNHVAAFGVGDGNNPATFYTQIACTPLQGTCGLTFGGGYIPVPIGAGIHLGIVFASQRAYGFYDDGSGLGWKLIPNQTGTGTDVTNLVSAPATIYMGEESGDADSFWDDFDIEPIALGMVP